MKTKNYKNLFYCIGLGMALALLPHAACAQEAEVPADSTRTAMEERTADKVPTVAYKGKVTDAATGLPVQGGIGPWHFAVIAGLSYYGITGNEAGAFAFVAHGSQMLLVVLIGIYAFISMACDKKKPDGERLVKDIVTEIPESDRL